MFHIFSTPLSLRLGEKVPVPLNRPESSLQSALWPAFTFVACFKGQHAHKTTVAIAWSRTLELSCEFIYLLFLKYFMCASVLLSCMCVYCKYDLQRPEEGINSPETKVTDVVNHIWETNLCSLQEQQDEPFPQPHLVRFLDPTSFSACLVIPTNLYAPFHL